MLEVIGVTIRYNSHYISRYSGYKIVRTKVFRCTRTAYNGPL